MGSIAPAKPAATTSPSDRHPPPAPPAGAGAPTERRARISGTRTNERHAPREPVPGANTIRLVLSTILGALCVLSLGGAILLLLLWQQDRTSTVLSTQLERAWDLFDVLFRVERIVAFAVVPVAVGWAALATVNVSRATGLRRSAAVAALSLPVGVAGIWVIGAKVVAESPDALGAGAGMVLQMVFAAIPLLALERVFDATESRRRPLRITFLISAAYLIHLQTLGGLSTIEPTSVSEDWGRLGAYLVIETFVLVLGALSINEAARSLEQSATQRYRARRDFGEDMLARAAR